MVSLFSWLIATVVTIPLIGVFLIYYLSMKITKNKRKSVHYTIDYSTFIFIFSVNYLMYVIWQKSFFWLIFLILILIAMLFVFIHWKVKQRIELRKIWKGFWRFNFLLFFISYFGLMVYGLIDRITEM